MRYRFLNQSAKPVTLTVAFPLPDIDLSESDNFAIPASDSVNFLGFETKIDGKPVTFTMNQRAVVGDKDVSALLRGLKVPLFALGVQHDVLADLTPAARDKLVEEGLLVPIGQTEQGKPIYGAGWKVKTSAVRQQTFPPNKPVLVEHRYKTARHQLRYRHASGPAAKRGIEQEVERYRMTLHHRQIPRRRRQGRRRAVANTAKVQDTHQLHAQDRRQWMGPIKQLRLLVDTASRSLVSLRSQFQTISPTIP